MTSHAPHAMAYGLLGVLAISICPTPTGAAQLIPSGPPAGATTVWCGYGRPLPTCDAVFISEVGFNVSVAGASRFPYFVLDVGALRNVTPRWGIGGSFYVGVGEGYILVAKPRVRRWLSAQYAIDFTPGLVLDATEESFPDWQLGLAFSFGDRVSLVAQVDYPERQRREPGRSWLLGFRVGLGEAVLKGIRQEDRCVPQLGRPCPAPPPRSRSLARAR